MISVETATAPTTAPTRLAWARRPATAGLVLLGVYLLLSLAVDPLVGLSTDTGGKTATVESMVREGGNDIDVGYWAEAYDPDGSVHPMWFTVHTEGGWLQVTTLPMVFAARPLWEVGGGRLALLLPMAGALAAAFAGRAIARRCRDDDDGWAAYWLVGLASPVLLYALDFWEHSIGLAFMAWGVVAAHDAVRDERVSRFAMAGAAFGAAATMRTEALVYGAVVVSIGCVWALLRTRVALAVTGGVAALVGVGIPLFANSIFERAVIGSSFRTDRASGAVRVGSDTTLRAKEALLTFTGLVPGYSVGQLLLGIALLGVLILLVRAALDGDPGRVRILAAVAAALYVIRAFDGLGFVPGLVATTPLAAAALAGGWRMERARFFLVAALAPLPLVWATQFTGGAGPQWAGRYILMSGLLLLVVGWSVLSQCEVDVRKVFVVLSAVVTLLGYGWLVQRTNSMADAFESLAGREEPVLIWGDAFLAREAGELNLDEQWLTAITAKARAEAAEVVDAAGYDEFGYVAVSTTLPDVSGWTAGESQQLELLPGVDLTVTTYRADGS